MIVEEDKIHHLGMSAVVRALSSYTSGKEPVDAYCRLLAHVLGGGWKSAVGFATVVNQSLIIIAEQEFLCDRPVWGSEENCDAIRNALPGIFRTLMPQDFAEEVIALLSSKSLM